MYCSEVVSQVLDGEQRPQFQPPQPSWSWERRACKVTPPRSSALLCSGFRAGAVAAWSSWHSLACPQYCVASLSGSQGFRLPFLRSVSEPTLRGCSPHMNSLLQCGHMGERQSGTGGRYRARGGQRAHRDGSKCSSGCLVRGCFSCSSSTDGGPGFIQLGVMNTAPRAAGE